MPASNPRKNLPDHAAVGLSVLCILHCLALPILAISLPVAATVTEAEWVHWAFAVLAVAASGSVAVWGHGARTPGFLVPAGLGALLIIGALFAEGIGVDETLPTVIGGVLIAFAHLRRLMGIAVSA
ncbi:MAG: MerC domain-containing protein [Pseudomonadota bacterium]